jgi:hypothetical protein
LSEEKENKQGDWPKNLSLNCKTKVLLTKEVEQSYDTIWQRSGKVEHKGWWQKCLAAHD